MRVCDCSALGWTLFPFPLLWGGQHSSDWPSTVQAGPAQLRLAEKPIPGREGLAQTPWGAQHFSGISLSLDPFSCGNSVGVAPMGLSWGSSAGLSPFPIPCGVCADMDCPGVLWAMGQRMGGSVIKLNCKNKALGQISL